MNTHDYNIIHSRALLDNFVSKCNTISRALDSIKNDVLSLSENITYMPVVPKNEKLC